MIIPIYVFLPLFSSLPTVAYLKNYTKTFLFINFYKENKSEIDRIQN